MEFHACCVNTGMVSGGCGGCWICRLMISHMCSIRDRFGGLAGKGNMSTLYRACCVTKAVLSYQAEIFSQLVWDNYESAPAVLGNCSPDHDSGCRSSLSRLHTVWLRVFPWPPSDQHMAITGTKVGPAFFRKHNRSSFRPPTSFFLTPLASQTSMAWSQWNTRYMVPGLDLS
ncbi:uncharacterized protein TNCV_2597931 [Trichonephila clavipes]|nr:uncharacterized protein TNCV_2597931 [Trichonephila clavipes]